MTSLILNSRCDSSALKEILILGQKTNYTEGIDNLSETRPRKLRKARRRIRESCLRGVESREPKWNGGRGRRSVMAKRILQENRRAIRPFLFALHNFARDHLYRTRGNTSLAVDHRRNIVQNAATRFSLLSLSLSLCLSTSSASLPPLYFSPRGRALSREHPIRRSLSLMGVATFNVPAISQQRETL